MDTVLSIALWGGLLFLMMRFGCGAHMFGRRHGSESKDGAHAGTSAGCCGSGGGKHDKDRQIGANHV